MNAPIYVGFKFPFGADSQTFPAPATNDDLVKADLIQLILSNKGERVMRGSLGADAYRFVFETNNDLLATQIRAAIAAAIGQFEPRVILRRIDIEKAASSKGQDPDSVIVTIHYVVPATQQQGQVTVALGQQQQTL